MIEMKNKLINKFVESRLKQVLLNDLDSYLVKDSNEAYSLQEIVNEKLSLSGLGEVVGYKKLSLYFKVKAQTPKSETVSDQ